MSDTKAFTYYGMEPVDAPKLFATFNTAAEELRNMQIAADIAPMDFAKQVFDAESIADLLTLLSRLPVFDKKFSNSLSHDLELLAIAKKLKYYTNLPLGQVLLLIQ